MATFPVLKTPDIVTSLAEFGLQCPAEDIDRPTSARCIFIYTWFLNHLTGLTVDDTRKASQEWLESAFNQASSGEVEMMQEAVHTGVLWETLNQHMRWALVDDFTIRDLRDPQAGRVRRILSALINFHLFEQEQSHLIDALEDAFERDEEARQRSADEIEQWQQTIADKEAALRQEADEVIKLQRENAERRQRLIRAKEMEEPALARIEQGKRERAALQEKVENVTMSLKQHEGETSRLRSRIVQSPDRVRQTLNDMANSLQSLKDELVEIDRKGREHESRILVAKKYEQEITSVIRLLDEWSMELSRSTQTSARLSTLTEEHDASLDDFRELDLRLQQLERRTASTQDQLAKQENIATSKKADVRTRMVKLQDSYHTVMQERVGIQAELDNKLKEIRAVEEAVTDLAKSTEAEMAQAEAAYKDLRNDVLTYSAKLNKALDSLNASIESSFS